MSRMPLIRALMKEAVALMILLTFPGDCKDLSGNNQIIIAITVLKVKQYRTETLWLCVFIIIMIVDVVHEKKCLCSAWADVSVTPFLLQRRYELLADLSGVDSHRWDSLQNAAGKLGSQNLGMIN